MAHPEDRPLSVLVIVLIVLLIAIPVAMVVIMAFGGFGTFGFEMMRDIGNSVWVIVIPAFGLLLVALILILILARPERGPLPPVPYPPYPAKPDEPLLILDRRLASGEITLDEYLKLRDHLTRK